MSLSPHEMKMKMKMFFKVPQVKRLVRLKVAYPNSDKINSVELYGVIVASLKTKAKVNLMV